MHLELYNRSYLSSNTEKKKYSQRVVEQFFVAANYDRLENYLLRILSRRKNSIVFDSGVYIWLDSQNRRLATSIMQTLRKKPKR